MQLISLNIWGGKLTQPLLSFIKEYSNTIDIFCFQEVYSSPISTKISRDMKSNIYCQIADILSNHLGYFAPHLIDRDLNGRTDFPLKNGLAIFINKHIKINQCDDIFIYRNGLELLDNDPITIPRNLQYFTCTVDKKDYLISHFHGIWYPKSKLDTPERIKQINKIKNFLSKREESILLCGDFNLLPNTLCMSILEDNMENLIKRYNIETTRNQYYERPEKYSDYILVSRDVKINKFQVLNVTVSDHIPLMVEFR